MLIIFDLDDTLIDTSGCITPVKLEDALRRMVEKGLELPDFEDGLELLKRLDSTAESSSRSLAEFLEILNADSSLLEVGIKEVYENIPEDLPVFSLEGAKEVLNELALEHQLALVTIGKPVQQMAKLKKAGIDSGLFSKIAVSEERNKKIYYKKIIEDLGYSSSEVAVCGDRIPIDLAPARELGCKTIQIRWGRGLNSTGFKSDVDYVISHLKELKEIISSLMTFSIF
ncbi:MAG: HAD family hydrolase [Rhabdochlamydiaceae bacterium]|nr:HAD family hydrolase [Rhabdochlamydiaceae bacterium]